MAVTVWSPGSSHIARGEFDSATDTLTITFSDGRTYDYMNVPPAVARSFQQAGSAGQYFIRHIKDRYPYEER